MKPVKPLRLISGRQILLTIFLMLVLDIQNQDNSYASDLNSPARRPSRFSIATSSLKISSATIMPLPPASPSTKQCRICLQNDDGDAELLAPCRCSGSIKYVHTRCFQRWVGHLYQGKSRREKEAMLKTGVQCEMCKQKVGFSINYTLNCVTCQGFKAHLNKHKVIFGLFIAFLFVNLACLTYLTFYSVTAPLIFSGSNFLSSIIILCAFVFLGATFFACLYYFLGQFFIKRVAVIQNFIPSKVSFKSNDRGRPRVNPQTIIQNIDTN